jgi:hypothetical protein
MSKALATQDNNTDVALNERDALLAQLRDQQEEEFDDSTVSVPMLKIGQPLTKEVQDDNSPAQAGDFINTLTGDSLGTSLGFIIAYYQKGRFGVDKQTNRAYVAFSEVIPEGWADFVGESFVGTPFAEYADAEERYKERVNAKEIEWGKGPKISTTHNYTGLAIVQLRDEDEQLLDDEFELQPVRLSLQRTNMPAVRKINSLKRMNLRPPKMFWDRVFDLSTEKKAFSQGAAHLLVPRLGRPTTAEEVEAAIELATAVAAGRVQEAGDKLDNAVEPDAKGGLGV